MKIKKKISWIINTKDEEFKKQTIEVKRFKEQIIKTVDEIKSLNKGLTQKIQEYKQNIKTLKD